MLVPVWRGDFSIMCSRRGAQLIEREPCPERLEIVTSDWNLELLVSSYTNIPKFSSEHEKHMIFFNCKT